MPNPPASIPSSNYLAKLGQQELRFYQGQTGIKNEDELKAHILDIQRRAYKIYPYPCIRLLGFLNCRVAKYSYYNQVLKLRARRPHAVFFDLGCCFGNDIRRVVEDGWPIQYTVGSDLRQEFWDLGHELFNSTPKSCPITFVAGDIFSNSILDLSTPPLSRRPALNQALASLTPLKNHISVIHTSAFFHLFGETAQRELAHRLGVLLSSNPGSIIFGSQIGAMDNQEYKEVTPQGREKYRHSPQSWTRLWDEVFGVGNCQVDTYNIPEEVRDSQNGMKAMDDWAPGLVHHTKLVWMVRRI